MLEGKYRRLIDRVTFDACQKVLQDKNRRITECNLPFANELFTCVYCSQAITGERIRRKLRCGGVREHVYYRCANNAFAGKERGEYRGDCRSEKRREWRGDRRSEERVVNFLFLALLSPLSSLLLYFWPQSGRPWTRLDLNRRPLAATEIAISKTQMHL